MGDKNHRFAGLIFFMVIADSCIGAKEEPCSSQKIKMDCPSNDCHRISSGLVCCKVGHHKNKSGECVDTNECKWKSKQCRAKYGSCVNTRGSYRCTCPLGMQGNGYNACGYVLSFHQIVNYEGFKMKTYATRILGFSSLTQKHERALRILAQAHSVLKVVIKTMTKISLNTTLLNITYDVYSTDSNFSAEHYSRNFSTRRKVLERGKIWFSGWSYPKADYPICTPTTIGFGRERFQFRTTKPGLMADSIETCPGTDVGAATITCDTRTQHGGAKIAFYSERSLQKRNCSEVADGMKKKLTKDTPKTKVVNETQSRFANLLTNGSADVARNFLRHMGQEMAENETAEISKSELNDVVHIMDFLLPQSEPAKSNSNDHLDIIFSFEMISSKVRLDSGEVLTMDTDLIALQVQPVEMETTSHLGVDFQFNETSVKTSNESLDIKSYLPGEAIGQVAANTSRDQLVVSFIVYKNSSIFDGTIEDNSLRISKVLSANVAGKKVSNLTQPFQYQIPVASQSPKKNVGQYFRCGFLDEDTKTWSSEGCAFVPSVKTLICECNHLTNFAVIVKNVKQFEDFALDISGKIGCAISIVGLVLMLACKLGFRSLRRVQTNQLHANLGVCLLMAYVILLIGVERTSNKAGCVVVAAILHFFLLASWGWMVVECVTMYKKLVAVLGYTGTHYVAKASAIVYSISLTIVFVTMGVTIGWYDARFLEEWRPDPDDLADFTSFYVTEGFCWLSGYPLQLGFLTPVAIAFGMNMIGFIWIIKSITFDRIRSSRTTTFSGEFKTYLMRASIMTFLFGLSWIFAIPLELTDDPLTIQIFSWLFSIFNSLQGFFIFFFFCVRRQDVRELCFAAIRKRLACFMKEKSAQTEVSGTTSTIPRTKLNASSSIAATKL